MKAFLKEVKEAKDGSFVAVVETTQQAGDLTLVRKSYGFVTKEATELVGKTIDLGNARLTKELGTDRNNNARVWSRFEL